MFCVSGHSHREHASRSPSKSAIHADTFGVTRSPHALFRLVSAGLASRGRSWRCRADRCVRNTPEPLPWRLADQHSCRQTTARYAHLADDPLHQLNEKIGDAIAKAFSSQSPSPGA